MCSYTLEKRRHNNGTTTQRLYEELISFISVHIYCQNSIAFSPLYFITVIHHKCVTHLIYILFTNHEIFIYIIDIIYGRYI